jgi:hypothetical protein
MNLDQPKRYAMVRGLGITADKVSAYLPRNFKVEGVALDRPFLELTFPAAKQAYRLQPRVSSATY